MPEVRINRNEIAKAVGALIREKLVAAGFAMAQSFGDDETDMTIYVKTGLPKEGAVDSSNIEAIGYDPESGEFHVMFKDGSHYIHEKCPIGLYDEFKACPSKGSFYHARIKNQLKTRKAE